MISRILLKLTEGTPCRLIPVNGKPYIERHYLGRFLGLNWHLNRYVSGDAERHLHNHPWECGFSLILCGQYLEEVAADICPHASDFGCITKLRKRRWFNRVDGNCFHRIREARRNTWTLFAHTDRVKVGGLEKGWGFLKKATGSSLTVFHPFPEPAANPDKYRNPGKYYPPAREVAREPL